LEKCDKIDIGLSVMESRDLVSVSRRVSTPRDPFFEVSVSKVSGLVSVSVSKDFGLGLGLELFDSRLCKVYFLWSFARSSGFKKWLLKILPFKEVSG